MPIAPTEWVSYSSKMGSNVVPLFVVLHSPPVAKPTKYLNGFVGSTAMSSTRPPCPIGPIDLQTNGRKSGFSDWFTSAISVSCAAAIAGEDQVAVSNNRLVPSRREPDMVHSFGLFASVRERPKSNRGCDSSNASEPSRIAPHSASAGGSVSES